MTVPLQLQADLSAKVVEYAQDPPVRSVDVVRIGILVNAARPESTRAGTELRVAFDRMAAIGGRPHEQSILQWTTPHDLAQEVRRRNLTIVYFTPGLDAEILALARELRGMRLITIAAVDSYVQSGAVLGFELVSGHPKMVFNAGQAKQQGVTFRSAVMKLMRIIE